MFKTLLFSILFIIHPVHVSLLSIDYIPDNAALNVFLKIYYDDFLVDSKAGMNKAQSLKFSGSDDYTRNFLENYVNEKLIISVDGLQIPGLINSYKLEDNDLSINLSVMNVRKINRLDVKNFIMTNIYADQANMLIVRVDDFEKGVKMTSVETEKTFNIK